MEDAMTPPPIARHGASRLVPASTLLACLWVGTAAQGAPPFTAFESGQVRPLALSPDKKLLFAVNTPDNRIEVFRVNGHGLTHRASIPVGLEPVAVAARNDHEVWVVNHLSDSISVVELSDGAHAGRVVRTLLVGDEPRDIVFGGPHNDRAFITTAHRGQNIPFDPQLTTPGVGRADVWVFDANDLGASLAGRPLTIITLFSDTPRALAVTPDGSKVYAAGFHTGNRTTSLHEILVSDEGEAAGGVPGPDVDAEGIPHPPTGIVVKFNGTHWVDELGRRWDSAVRFNLPDKDVFVIDAKANPPAQIPGAAGFYTGVGTILFNMAVNPVNGKVYVSNTEASNEKRFEGPGIFAGHSLRGNFSETRITVLTPAGGVIPRHLNKHIDFDTCCAPVPNTESEKSLALPQQMAITRDGRTLYVAALGSSEIGIFNTTALENDTFVPSTARQIPVTGGGPTGIVLDEGRDRLYVLTRFDDSISVIDTTTKAEVAHVPMHNPEPPSVLAGRRFLYDTSFSSSHGDSSCASCHIFGDFDSLAWDLGNPDGAMAPVPGPFALDPVDFGLPRIHHPMKGPMTTQSLRGMANHGPMHWRGDRTGGNDTPSAQPDSGTFDEEAGFKKFAMAFVNLLGRSEPPSDAEMQAFTDFILQVSYPPNPVRALENSLTPAQQAGRTSFFNDFSNPAGPCEACHVLDRHANEEFGVAAPGFFGTDGRYTFDLEVESFKTPHLRNAYQKVGMFGMPDNSFFPGSDDIMGDQIRGFGFNHEGGVDTLFRFVSSSSPDMGFNRSPATPGGFPPGPEGVLVRQQQEQFILAFDSNMAPIVGQQVTLTCGNATAAGPRIDLLVARADVGECDLVAKGLSQNNEVGFLYVGAGMFVGNRLADPMITDAALRRWALSRHVELTYTCTPPGSGERIGFDRDGDGFRDGDEEDAGDDPADPSSHPLDD
jgi:YVTN family beta-propeller protein